MEKKKIKTAERERQRSVMLVQLLHQTYNGPIVQLVITIEALFYFQMGHKMILSSIIFIRGLTMWSHCYLECSLDLRLKTESSWLLL